VKESDGGLDELESEGTFKAVVNKMASLPRAGWHQDVCSMHRRDAGTPHGTYPIFPQGLHMPATRIKRGLQS
jgi:hypothetical protein